MVPEVFTPDQNMAILNWLEALQENEMTLGDVIEGMQNGELSLSSSASFSEQSLGSTGMS